MLKCYLNEMLSIICRVLFTKLFYISLFMCLLYVRWLYNVCVIQE